MGKGKTLLVLVLLLLGCIGAYCFLFRQDAVSAEDASDEAETLVISIASDQVQELSWESAARELVFSRESGNWLCTSEKHFPVNQDSLHFAAMLSALESVTATHCLERPAEAAEYGLDSPTNQIRVTQKDGTYHCFLIGDGNSLAGGYYMQLDDDPRIYLIGPELVDAFQCGLFDLVDTDEIPDLSQAVLYRIGARTLHLQSEDDGSRQWCDANGSPLPPETSSRLAQALLAFSWSQCIDFYADSDEVKSYEYNLEHGQEVTVTISNADGNTENYSFVIGNAYDKEYTIVSPVESDIVYTVRSSVTDALLLKQ